MNRTAVLIAISVCVFAVFIAVVLIDPLADDAPEFGKGSYSEIEEAVNRGGLELDVGETGEADITGGYEKTAYTVSTQDGTGEGLMIVRAFSGPDQIDAIDQDTYVGDSALGYRWQQYTISLTASNPPEVIAMFRSAMDKLGAKVIYDHVG